LSNNRLAKLLAQFFIAIEKSISRGSLGTHEGARGHPATN
jgi:hypothetical protein